MADDLTSLLAEAIHEAICDCGTSGGVHRRLYREELPSVVMQTLRDIASSDPGRVAAALGWEQVGKSGYDTWVAWGDDEHGDHDHVLLDAGRPLFAPKDKP